MHILKYEYLVQVYTHAHCSYSKFNVMILYRYIGNDVVEAHCYALQCRQIDCEQIRIRINQQLIAGRFGHEGLRQLRTKL